MRMNAKRSSYDYVVNQQVLKDVHMPPKLGVKRTGPYRVAQVHTNGTLTIELAPNVTERLSIRQLSPYRLPT